MPVIAEETDQLIRELAEQMPQHAQPAFDEDALALALTEAPTLDFLSTAKPQSNCPAHPGVEDCLCQSFIGDWNLSETASTLR